MGQTRDPHQGGPVAVLHLGLGLGWGDCATLMTRGCISHNNEKIIYLIFGKPGYHPYRVGVGVGDKEPGVGSWMDELERKRGFGPPLKRVLTSRAR